MAHFYGNLKGSRGEVTRCGTKGSGIQSHIRGWNVGVEILIYYNEVLKKDVCEIYLTNGSNHRKNMKHIGTFTEGYLDIGE